MSIEDQEHKQFLEQQLQWCNKRDRILEEIELKLHEMSKIAQLTLEHELTALEIDQWNHRFKELQKEIDFLELQLHSVVN